jgi:6-phosphogluconolactonase (cycloisomerase 2 family)
MIRIDPKGRFAYVMDYSGNTVKPFLIERNGMLSPQRDVATRLHPIDMAFDFTGNVAYVTEFGNNSVQPFAIDNLTGMLTQLGPSMNVGGAGPVALVVAPTP